VRVKNSSLQQGTEKWDGRGVREGEVRKNEEIQAAIVNALLNRKEEKVGKRSGRLLTQPNQSLPRLG